MNIFLNSKIPIDKFLNYYNLNHYFDFECDILNKFTLIELLHNENCRNEFKKTVTYLMENTC